MSPGIWNRVQNPGLFIFKYSDGFDKKCSKIPDEIE
jgi:hypothetical protein